jgi:hypothetical protein
MSFKRKMRTCTVAQTHMLKNASKAALHVEGSMMSFKRKMRTCTVAQTHMLKNASKAALHVEGHKAQNVLPGNGNFLNEGIHSSKCVWKWSSLNTTKLE